MKSPVRGMLRVSLILAILTFGFWLNQGRAQGLKTELFFDGSDDPRLQGTRFTGEPVVDSQGRVLVVSARYDSSFFWVNAISPKGNLEWQTSALRGRSAAPSSRPDTGLFLGPGGRVYATASTGGAGPEIIYAFDSSGNPVPGWPVNLPVPSGWVGLGLIVDRLDGTVYVKSEAQSAPPFIFPFSVFAFNPDGGQRWRRDYVDDGNGGYGNLVQGPDRHLYTTVMTGGSVTRLLVLDRGNGS